MLSITINKKPAVIKAGSSIKLTKVNPYFGAVGDYTLEIVCPLKGCAQNAQIFGAMHLPQTQLRPALNRTYYMTILAPPVNLKGEAHVTMVTDEEVRLQFVGGKGLLTNAMQTDEVYIDELDLGYAWEEVPPFYDGAEEWDPSMMTLWQFKLVFYQYARTGAEQTRPAQIMMRGSMDETDCVVFPTMTADKMTAVNNISTRQRTESPTRKTDRGFYWLATTNDEMKELLYDSNKLAPQPYLFRIWRAIAQARGFREVDDSFYTAKNKWTRGLFIVSATESLDLSQALPHWTLAEFVREMENLLGAVCVVGQDGRSVALVPRNSFYKNNEKVVKITRPLDERQAELDNEGQQDTTAAGNVDYDYPEADDILRIPDDVWAGADVRHKRSLAEIQQEVNAMTKEQRALSPAIWVTPTACYALLHRADAPEEYELQRVNQMSPLIRSFPSREIDVELRMVPARWMIPEEGNYDWSRVPHLISHTAAEIRRTFINVDSAINPDGAATEPTLTKEDGPDVMTIALNPTGADLQWDAAHAAEGPIHLAMGIPYVRDEVTGFPTAAPQVSAQADFPLNGPFDLSSEYNGQDPTIWGTVHDLIDGTDANPIPLIDQRVEYTISFADQLSDYDPTRPYIINGRRYACKSLELTLDENGLNPIKVGHFYALEE